MKGRLLIELVIERAPNIKGLSISIKQLSKITKPLSEP
jgi:hypothetical protein